MFMEYKKACNKVVYFLFFMDRYCQKCKGSIFQQTCGKQQRHVHQFGVTMNSTQEFNKFLRRSGKDTAPGPDRIQYCDIKNLTEEDRSELCTIYQEDFDKGYIPKDWTDSFLRPIPKPRKDVWLSSQSGDTRPFSSTQLGFCFKHSCSALLDQLTDLWFSAINVSDLSRDVFWDL